MEPDDQVTVVIPTKDRSALLPSTVASVLAQAGVEVRVVVVDDGGTVPAARSLPEDPRVRVLRHDAPKGVSAARNAGLAAAASAWVAFLDDDDLWGPHKLRRQLDAVHATGHRWACSATVSFAGSQVIGVADPPPGGDLSRAILHGNVVSGSASSVLARTDLVRGVGGFDEDVPSMEDWDLWIRLAQESSLACVTSTDVAYRVHPGSRGHDLAEQPRALRLMQDKYAALTPPLQVEPDAWFLEYWARMDYDAGRWSAGLRRTADLVIRRRHLAAVRTPARAVLPEAAQRRVRAHRVAQRARRRADQDWTWLDEYLRPA